MANDDEAALDYVIMAIYFVVVLGIGLVARLTIESVRRLHLWCVV